MSINYCKTSLFGVVFPEIFDMAVVVKLQYLLIGLVGAEFNQAVTVKEREDDYLKRYERKVHDYLSGELAHFPLKPVWLNADRLFVLNGRQLNGKRLWRLFREIRAFVTTKINPLYRELTSGESLMDLSLEMREKLWIAQQSKRRKRKFESEMEPFDEFWEPNEWLLFLYCGRGGLHINCFSEVVHVPYIVSDQGFERFPLMLATYPAKRVHAKPADEESSDSDDYIV
jgi:hypothetical protein